MTLCSFADRALAQTNLRGWHASGQTWLVWTDDKTFSNAQTYNIHVSSAPITDLLTAPLAGRLFPNDWKATRLTREQPGLRWTIPNGAGGNYTLAANEAMFTYTPHTATPAYFAVVQSGSNSTVTPGINSLVSAIVQTLDPVTCHVQFSGTDRPSGQTFKDYAFWLDGQADQTNNRADFPVMGNEHFHGVACLFRVFDPPGGVRTSPMPTVLVMHGNGGAWMSGSPIASTTYLNRRLDDGLVVNLDDHQYSYDATNVALNGIGIIDSETRWFGYAKVFDRFSDAPRTSLPAASLVVPYTLRRTVWLVDWLVANRNADSKRIALMGHSMGGGGVSLTVRYAPEKFCAATAFAAPINPTNNGLGPYMQGTSAQLLPIADLGEVLVRQAYYPAVPLSNKELPVINFFWGVNDTDVNWPNKPTLINNLDATLWGSRLWWDERGHNQPWTGHWVNSPRLSAQYLVGFRNNQSFPAFSLDTHADNNPSAAIPGDLTAKNWGVKNGYYDWETSSITDTTESWSTTMYLVGNSTFTNDVPTFASATTSVSIRRAQRFKPPGTEPLTWSLRRVSDGVILQSGTTTINSTLVTIPGVTLFKDPVRCRLEVKYASASVQPVALTILESNPATLELTGLPGQSSLLETSTDLVQWQALETITLPTTPTNFIDTQSESSPRRFYRTRLP